MFARTSERSQSHALFAQTAGCQGLTLPSLQFALFSGQTQAQQSFNPHTQLAIAQQRKQLPIYKWRDHILYALERKQVLILLGEVRGSIDP